MSIYVNIINFIFHLSFCINWFWIRSRFLLLVQFAELWGELLDNLFLWFIDALVLITVLRLVSFTWKTILIDHYWFLMGSKLTFCSLLHSFILKILSIMKVTGCYFCLSVYLIWRPSMCFYMLFNIYILNFIILLQDFISIFFSWNFKRLLVFNIFDNTTSLSIFNFIFRVCFDWQELRVYVRLINILLEITFDLDVFILILVIIILSRFLFI